jgi:hypothetical protein
MISSENRLPLFRIMLCCRHDQHSQDIGNSEFSAMRRNATIGTPRSA